MKAVRDISLVIGATAFFFGAGCVDSVQQEAAVMAVVIVIIGLAFLMIGLLIERRYCFEEDDM